jgi:predicted O-methyltransferase YrrM
MSEPAHDRLAEIYRTRQVIDAAGAAHPLHSETTPDERDLIVSLIARHGCTRTLEIGCAFGLSSLAICGALASRSADPHTIVDPGQFTEWKGIGVHQLRQCGARFTLIEQPSELAMPDLIRQGRTFQFVLIDGFHTFDHVLLDFFFADRLLEHGGIVVLDDLQLPGIRKVARYVRSYPNYRVAGTAKPSVFAPSRKRRIVDGLVRGVAAMLPASYVERSFDPSLFSGDFELGLTSEMVAFQKVGDDRRESHWYRPF